MRDWSIQDTDLIPAIKWDNYEQKYDLQCRPGEAALEPESPD